MNERLSLQIHDFLLEGRDEEKSHVILEIAKPVPEELETHGSFIVLVELRSATPKTIQMVRAWVEFAIDAYYSTTPSNLEQHFEDVLQRLNTQSALYLKQHPEIQLDMAAVAIQETRVFLAFHGAPSMLLFYRKQEAWHAMNLVESEVAPGALFSNVMTGALRTGDRLCIASPRVIEFFPADRIAKLCDAKSTAEVSEHMSRVLSDLGSDLSFAACWAEVEKVMIPDPPPAPSSPEQKTVQSVRSMKELMRKTNSTESLLSPPVLTIPKDKIVTHTLQAVQRGAGLTGRATVNALRTSFFTIKHVHAPLKRVCTGAWCTIQNIFKTGTNEVQKKKRIALVVGVIIAVSAASAWTYHIHQAQLAQDAEALARIRTDIQAADEAFTYQNTDRAGEQIALARQEFNGLSRSARASADANSLGVQLAAEEQKIYQIYPAVFEQVGTDVAGAVLTMMRNTPLVMKSDGTVAALKNGTLTTLGKGSKNATLVLYDDAKDRVITLGKDLSGALIPAKSGATVALNLERASGNAQADAAVMYNGRLYVYDGAVRAIYKYNGTDVGFGGGAAWLKDSSKPVDVNMLQADTSLWALAHGSLLKFTAGKAQPFTLSKAIPAVNTIDAFTLGPVSNMLYVLDRGHNRAVVVGRDGTFKKQYRFPAGQNLVALALDEKETAMFGATDDGKLVKFAITK